MKYPHLTLLGKLVRFLSWFTFIPMVILFFLGYSILADVLFMIWLVSGILAWIVKI